MKTFVTGVTGVLGKAVTPELIANGHAISELSRQERKMIEY
jgi:NAD dependent epimerase/dehydratase family enzyme